MENSVQQFINAKIFTGSGWMEHGTVLIDNGRIANISTEVVENIKTVDCGGNSLVPAFLDLQIYGAGGRLFSAYPDAESLSVLAAENLKGGTVGCLATIATQPLDIIYKSVATIQNYWQQGGKGILGMHLEGPYMNPIKRGAHKLEWMRVPTEKEVGDLLEFAAGAIKMVTLATEICSPAVIKMFVDAGVIVSAGHSNATYNQAINLPTLGVNVATHLFNAMSPLHHRDAGLPGALFDSPALRASIIPDGIHVSYAALRIAKKQMGERLHFITDAVTETTTGEYQHHLNGDHYCIADGTLSGSALTMLQGVKNSVLHAQIPVGESLRMASLYPAQIMGLENDYGTIEVGKKAAFLLLNESLEMKWVIS
jgi:N-acetylglucosamine-6-phosphate deacetylase